MGRHSSSQTSQTLNLEHDFPLLFPPPQNQDHLLREELEILRKKYDRSKQDYQIMKKLYEDKIDNEIEIKLKNTTSEMKKFKLEHPNNFDTKSDLTCHNVKIESSSLGQFDEPSPSQTVAGKDTSNSFMGEAFPKSLLLQITQQVV